jgi:hypothetical protein
VEGTGRWEKERSREAITRIVENPIYIYIYIYILTTNVGWDVYFKLIPTKFQPRIWVGTFAVKS